jgi:hypothetical protein
LGMKCPDNALEQDSICRPFHQRPQRALNPDDCK